MNIINLNSKVRLVLTPKGLDAYKTYVRREGAKRLRTLGETGAKTYENRMLEKVDESGYMEEQLGNIIKIFGNEYDDGYFQNNSLYMTESEFKTYNDD